MTRWLPWLAELQPALFVEMSPELAVELGIRNGDWVTVETARAQVEARALVTGRIAPLRLGKGRFVHQIGMPFHFGAQGLVTGDSPNDLPPNVADPNVSIHEGKAFTCNLRLGRRGPRGGEATQRGVPADEQRPLGAPDRPGPVRAPHDAAPAVASETVSPETVMRASEIVNRREAQSRKEGNA
jgi:hypothetical protein